MVDAAAGLDRLGIDSGSSEAVRASPVQSADVTPALFNFERSGRLASCGIPDEAAPSVSVLPASLVDMHQLTETKTSSFDSNIHCEVASENQISETATQYLAQVTTVTTEDSVPVSDERVEDDSAQISSRRGSSESQSTGASTTKLERIDPQAMQERMQLAMMQRKVSKSNKQQQNRKKHEKEHITRGTAKAKASI